MTVTELGLRSPWLFIARRFVHARRESRSPQDNGHARRHDEIRADRVPARITAKRPDAQRITLLVDGHPEPCAYLSLVDAVASLSRRPLGRSYEIHCGGKCVFRFGVSLETGRARS